MRKHAFVLAATALLLITHTSHAVPDREARALRDDGVTQWENGDFDLARRRFGEAGSRAQQTKDWETLLSLTEDYLILVPDDAGHDNDNLQAAQNMFVWATSTCYDQATFSSSRPGSGRDCPDGLAGCRAVVEKWENSLSALPASPIRSAFEAQANIARRVSCQPAPGNNPPTPPTPPTPPAPPAGNDPVFDRVFGAPQYFVHSIKIGTQGGDRAEDVHFCFPNKPDERGSLVLPDGSGGTFWRQIDWYAGPFTTPRQVCASAKSRGVGNATYQAWARNWWFNCAELP